MDALRAQTEGVLEQFNLNFQQSRNELINRFLKDQQSLNKKFEEYNLACDNEAEKDYKNNPGVTIDDVNKRYGQSKSRYSDDNNSVTSLLTECSFSDDGNEVRERPKSKQISKSGNKRPVEAGKTSNKVRDNSKIPTSSVKSAAKNNNAFTNRPESKTISNSQVQTVEDGDNGMTRPSSSASRTREDVCQKLSLSTPRFGVPDRTKSQPFTRSKSLRAPAKTNTTSHMEQPPNSPEINRKGGPDVVKPPLDNIKMGRKEKQEKPKKLLSKRIIRPKTAMGLQTERGNFIAIMPDAEFQRRPLPNPSSWDDATSSKTGITVRSAALPIRHRVLTWDQPNDDWNKNSSIANSRIPVRPPSGKNKVNTFPPSINFNNDDNNQPSYTVNNEINRPISVRRSAKGKSIKPFVKSQSEYFGGNSREVVVANVQKSEYTNVNSVGKGKNSSNTLVQEPGTLRRFKGHGNLTSSAKGTQLAVLKLPPVAKAAHQEIPSRSSTSMGYFRKETTVMKMMPVHIVEEF